MEYELPHYKAYNKELLQIAQQFSLDPNKLKIEFFTPHCQAIVVEQVDGHIFKVHINLEENRIVSIKRLSNGIAGNLDYLKEKYRRFMK